MKKIGNLEISFKEYKDGVYYYDVELKIGEKVVSIVLPRYHTFLGWIEVFGLPPQNEWCVLDNLGDFENSGVLKINGSEVLESIKYTPGKNTHTIQTTREHNNKKEVCVWKQDYTEAPKKISSETNFDNNYKANWETEILADKTLLTESEMKFVSDIIERHGEPDVLARKTLKASGEIPPLYYMIFPIEEFLDTTNLSGSVIELGYLYKDSEHEIDNVHGDWYKQFDFGNQRLYVNETNYSSCEINTGEKTERIKNTYRKELFSE